MKMNWWKWEVECDWFSFRFGQRDLIKILLNYSFLHGLRIFGICIGVDSYLQRSDRGLTRERVLNHFFNLNFLHLKVTWFWSDCFFRWKWPWLTWSAPTLSTQEAASRLPLFVVITDLRDANLYVWHCLLIISGVQLLPGGCVATTNKEDQVNIGVGLLPSVNTTSLTFSGMSV